MQPISTNYAVSTQRTKGGSYVNSLDIPMALIPGNFGCRVVDNMMPTDLSTVHKDRRTTLVQNFVCENTTWKVPALLQQPDTTDYLTDEESDEGAGFELKIPALDELISEFESGDQIMEAFEETAKAAADDRRARGLEKEPREDIKLVKSAQRDMLDHNIERQRALGAANLPGKLSELNSTIKTVQTKIYLR